MKRLITLLVAVVLIAAMLAGCGGGGGNAPSGTDFPTPENPIVLKMGYDPPPGDITDLAANFFKDFVEEHTNGAVIIELYPQNQLGSMQQMLDGVLSGTIEIVLSPWNMLTTVMPEFNAMTLPFNIDNIDLYWRVVSGDEFHERVNELVNPRGVVFLGTPSGSPRSLITNSPVRVPDDLRGLNIRVMDGPIYTDMFNAWGASTAVISFAEVYTALQQGVVQGLDSTPGMGVQMRFFEVANYFTPTNHIIHGVPMLINQTFWDRLSPEQQDIMRQAGREMEVFSAAAFTEINDRNMQRGIDEFGMTVVEFTDADLQLFIEASRPVNERYRDIIGAEFFDWFMPYVDSLR